MDGIQQEAFLELASLICAEFNLQMQQNSD